MILCYLVPEMASIVTVKPQLFALSLIVVFVYNGKLGNAVYELVPSNGAQSGNQNSGQSGSESGFSGAQSGSQNGGQSGGQGSQFSGGGSGGGGGGGGQAGQFGGGGGQAGQFGGSGGGGQAGQFGGGGGGGGGQAGQFGGGGGQAGQFGGGGGGQAGQFGGGGGGQAGGSVEDQSSIVEKALLCFNDNYVYSSCQENYRLTETGDLHVPPEATEEFCHGPCVSETHLVLNCIGNVMTHFEFYNKATLEDVSDTIKSGCGSGNQRGNFNVAEHVQDDQSNGGNKIITQLAAGFVLMILVQGLLL